MSGLRVLVCGGRHLDQADVWNWLERTAYAELAEITSPHAPVIAAIIHGGATGADAGADSWGRSENLKVIPVRANWRRHGNAAGPIRNQWMVDNLTPDVVIAFPGGRGTADMVRRAKAAGIPVIEVPPATPSPQEDAP